VLAPDPPVRRAPGRGSRLTRLRGVHQGGGAGGGG
jgi:hypothetical protein